jgi:hypothetical protein
MASSDRGSVIDLLGGGLRPNDPRRFLIEAMVGAMSADGVREPRELAAVEEQIRSHPLFRGLAPNAAKTLVDLSNDAIDFAGSSVARAPAIAKGLPSRIHRLAAYGMAAEIAVADEVLVEGELQFLEALRIALRISPLEARQIVSAAQGGGLPAYIEDRYSRLRTLIPVVSEVFALRALARACATDEQRFAVRDFFAALPDLAVARDDLDAELFRAFRRPRPADAQVFGELARVAGTLPDPVDRYWMVVYALVAEPPATVPSWRVVPFLGVMQAAFQITDTDMELAVVDALTFPTNLPRP